MNRRKFLKWLGVGVTAGVAAPYALLKKEPATVVATLGEYANESTHVD